MEDNRRTTHSVDDYYPKPSRDEEPQQEQTSGTTDSDKNTTDGGSYADNAYDYGSSGNTSDENTDADSNNTWHNDRDTYSQNRPGADEYTGRTLTCPRCGNEVPGNMNFCSLCGYHFPKSTDTPYPLNSTRIDGYLIDDIAQFVGPNYNTYLKKFQRVSEGHVSFNWAAAIFSNRWMAYRGMFRQAVIFSLILNAFSGVISYLILTLFQSLGTQLSDSTYLQLNMFSMALTVCVGLIVGLIGDSMYWKRTKKIMDQLSCKGREALSNQRIAKSLRTAGGCKMGYAILIIFFDLSMNQIISSVLAQLLGQ